MSDRAWARMRERRRAAGLCVGCGVVPPTLARERCAGCLAKASISTRRMAKGHCVVCDERTAGDVVRCPRCEALVAEMTEEQARIKVFRESERGRRLYAAWVSR